MSRLRMIRRLVGVAVVTVVAVSVLAAAAWKGEDRTKLLGCGGEAANDSYTEQAPESVGCRADVGTAKASSKTRRSY